MKPRILALAGSTRSESFNKKLVREAAEGARKAGSDVTVADLRDYPMPLYDGDLEAKGFPAEAKRFKDLLLGHEGLLIASPEYNSSVSGVLKNAIDWASRAETAGEKPLACFAGKTAALLSASPGALGGLRGLVHLRSILGNIGVLVLPDQVAVPKADSAFAADGSLSDDKTRQKVHALGAALSQILLKIHA